MTNNEPKSLITVEELAEWLMIGKSATYKLLASGDIKVFRIGRIWKIPIANVNEYIQKQSHLPEGKFVQ